MFIRPLLTDSSTSATRITVKYDGVDGGWWWWPVGWKVVKKSKNHQKSKNIKGVMSWSRDLPITWSRHMTTHMICSHDLDTWPANFILTSSHYQYHHPRHHSHVMTTSGSLICHMTATSSHHHGMHCPSSTGLVWALSRMLWRPTKKTTLRLTLVLESGGSSLIKGKCPWTLLVWLRGSAFEC